MRISQLAAQKTKLLLRAATHSAPTLPRDVVEPRPEMLCFRGQTLALVRHFFEISSQLGRVASLLGREFFRSRVSHHAIPSFEEQAVFARDVEICLLQLCDDDLELVTLVGLYDFSHDEVGDMLHLSRTRVGDRFYHALDCLSEIFLRAGLLCEGHADRHQRSATASGAPDDTTDCPRKPPRSVSAVSAMGSMQRTRSSCGSPGIYRW